MVEAGSLAANSMVGVAGGAGSTHSMRPSSAVRRVTVWKTAVLFQVISDG